MSELRAFRRPRAATADIAQSPFPDSGLPALRTALDHNDEPLPEILVANAIDVDAADPRLDFQSEEEIAVEPSVARPAVSAKTRVRPAVAIAAAVAALGVAAAGVYGAVRPRPRVSAAPALAMVSLMTNPDGADVSIDGTPRGKAPLKIALTAGSHQLEVHHGSRTRSMPLSVEAGALVSQYVELAPAEPLPRTGRLEISTETPGAQVTVDGEPRGVTPLSLSSVAPGQHRVQVAHGDARVLRTVDVPEGAVASIMVALAAPTGVSAGWVSVDAPFELRVLEDGQLLGTTSADRLMMAAGRHTLEFVNTSLEFKARHVIEVPAGKTAKVPLSIPNGSLSVNALPWAEVSLDGRPLGITPLGNISVPIGSHEVVWRHPQLGERRRTVAVTASSAVRVGMDFSK
jgi:hypothetical protein